ncbi:MAG: tetraacyldisaccharide 4'-kinase [Deltaproteobacteria bacterium]|nr:tetraacyldisaccharide 4'-kinase [Deltaproteobacteria bacterium]
MAGTLRKNIERWMREDKIGLVPHNLLFLLSLLYGLAIKLRLFLFKRGFLSTKELPCKVISIGNITVGGTGKTPMAIHVAGLIRKRNNRVVILSRGYKRSTRDISVVSDGQKILLSAQEAGDEPYLMAKRLKDVPVIVGSDRYLSGMFAVENFNPDVIILDDGYQHIKLKRDLNILLVDAEEGFGNGYLLPRGVLREPLEGIERASIVMVKGGHLTSDERSKIQSVPVIPFSYSPSVITDIKTNASKDAGYLKGKKAIAIAGIANPGSFFETLKSLGVKLVKAFTYPDHHLYTNEDIDSIKKGFLEAELIITTEKDGVKLKGRVQTLPLYVLSIDVEVKGKEALENAVNPLLKGAGDA